MRMKLIMPHSKACELIQGFTLPIHHIGPSLDQGPLPSLFYFALGGEESLTLDPYNQPVTFLSGQRARVFSLSLPGHGHGFTNYRSLAYWAKNLGAGCDIISDFIGSCRQALDFLIAKGFVDTHHIAVAGLSRGAFIATQLAAADERIKIILGFSPLTLLDRSADFNEIEHHPLVQELGLLRQVDRLANKSLRYYIGNRDTCVGTEDCFIFIKELTEAAYRHKHRSPPIELVIFPSIGHQGHGTPAHIFRAGTDWLLDCWHVHK